MRGIQKHLCRLQGLALRVSKVTPSSSAFGLHLDLNFGTSLGAPVATARAAALTAGLAASFTPVITPSLSSALTPTFPSPVGSAVATPPSASVTSACGPSLAVLQHLVVVVHGTGLVTGLAVLPDADHAAALFSQAADKRCEI